MAELNKAHRYLKLEKDLKILLASTKLTMCMACLGYY